MCCLGLGASASIMPAENQSKQGVAVKHAAVEQDAAKKVAVAEKDATSEKVPAKKDAAGKDVANKKANNQAKNQDKPLPQVEGPKEPKEPKRRKPKVQEQKGSLYFYWDTFETLIKFEHTCLYAFYILSCST